jgi:hypothetical protein
MNRAWPREAVEYGAAVRGSLERAGGVDVAREAETIPTIRVEIAKDTLAALGAFELDPTGDPLEAAIAALAVQAAGSVVWPWPLVQELAVPADLRRRIGALHLGGPGERRLEHADLHRGGAAAWSPATRTAYGVLAAGPVSHMPLDPFGSEVVVGDELAAELRDAGAMLMILSAFWALGALSYAAELAARYAATRRQFGHAIVDFGGIQTRLAEIAVARDGLAELAAYTLWLEMRGQATHADCLALRLAMLESAATVLVHAHQVFASIGLCEEHDLAVLDRHLQPLLRRPAGRAATRVLLAHQIRCEGFDGIYPIPPRVGDALALEPAVAVSDADDLDGA